DSEGPDASLLRTAPAPVPARPHTSAPGPSRYDLEQSWDQGRSCGRIPQAHPRGRVATTAHCRAPYGLPAPDRSIRVRGVPIAPPRLTPVLDQAPSRWRNLQSRRTLGPHAARQSLDPTRSLGGTSRELG